MLTDWLKNSPINSEWLAALATISLVTFLLSLIVIPWIVVRLPADYFTDETRPKLPFKDAHPIIGLSINLLKNIMGVVLIIAGILMLVLPGQGILTILIGLGLVNFPGKYKLERYLVTKTGVLKGMNWLRKKANKPPLRVTD